MKSDSAVIRFFRLTVRELFVLSALVAIVLVAMRYPDVSWWWLSAAAMPLVFVTAVLAVSARGKAQHWSRGFVVCLATYAAMVHFSPRSEMSATGWLPTTAWLAMCEPKIWSQATGDIAPSFPESEYATASYPVNIDGQSHYRTGHLVIGLGWALTGARLACSLQD